MTAAGRTKIVIEAGEEKTFAAAVEWPGWCRSGPTEEAAVRALIDYAPRYAVVAQQAGIAFPGEGADTRIIERLTGDGTDNDPTAEAGAPHRIAAADRRAVTAPAAQRLAALVSAAWSVFDETRAAAPAELRGGPSGNGRDRDAIVAHVLAAEAAYARAMGIHQRAPAIDDLTAIEELREEIATVLATPAEATPAEAASVGAASPRNATWPPRYAARRIAWHVLDHAWEIADHAI